MINKDAIKKFETFYWDFEDVFSKYDADFRNNIQIYIQLKGMLHEMDVSANEDFQRLYSKFYGVRRLPVHCRREYFIRLESLKNTTDTISVGQLTKEMKPSLGKFHFSFCSKMADIIDDKRYPIFDSNVYESFKRRLSGSRLEQCIAIYKDITDTYKKLKNNPVLTAFKNKYRPIGMGYMKMLDALFWVIGKTEIEKRKSTKSRKKRKEKTNNQG